MYRLEIQPVKGCNPYVHNLYDNCTSSLSPPAQKISLISTFMFLSDCGRHKYTIISNVDKTSAKSWDVSVTAITWDYIVHWALNTQ